MTYTRHGHGSDTNRSPTYRAWESMIQRCTNPRHQRWDSYGGKGIVVDPTWRSFPNFLKDMGPKPTRGHQLGRIRLDHGYTPQNCRWLTRKQIGVMRQATRKGWDQVGKPGAHRKWVALCR
jgi:hypothetical protein